MTYITYPLIEVCNFIDYRGKTPPKTTSGIPLITAKIIKNGYILEPSEFIAPEFYDEWMRRGIPQKGSIIFTTEAPLGEVAKIQTDEKLAFAQRVIIFEPISDILYGDYLLYALQESLLKSRIEAKATGTTVIGIKSSELKKVEIDLPPLQEQKAIADTLSILDRNIELNNQANKVLEEMAQAIFKSWFVDFEPFGGETPEDWEVGTLSDFGTIVGGSTPSKAKPEYYTEDEIAWITPKDLSRDKSKFIGKGECDITELGLKNSSAKKMPRGTVLFSSRAPIGYTAIAKNEVTTNQGFKSIVPFENIGTAFVYFFLKENLSLIEGVASGTTFKEVSGSAMKSIPVRVPSSEKLKEFSDICKPLFAMQEKNEEEIKTLTEIRNTLLPKLMSGEVRVPLGEVE